MTLPDSAKLQPSPLGKAPVNLSLNGGGQSLFLLAVLLVMAVSAIYGQFLWNPIVFDDAQFFMAGGHVLDHYNRFAPLEVRWLPYATLSWTANLAGLDLIWFRLEGLVLHAATGVALFFFLQRLFVLTLNKEADRRDRLSHVWVAFFWSCFLCCIRLRCMALPI